MSHAGHTGNTAGQVSRHRSRASSRLPALCLALAALLLTGSATAQQVRPAQVPSERLQAEELRVLTPQLKVREPQRSGDFPMPSVVGMSIPEAERAVLAAGKAAGAGSAKALVEYREDSRPAGQIIAQLQRPGQAMRPYRDDVGGVYGQVTFNVVASRGIEAAPSFIGMSIRQAQREAEALKISLGVAEPVPDPETPRGIVVVQDPLPDRPMQRRRVTVRASDGYPLPDFRRRGIEDAIREADKLGVLLEAKAEERIDVPEGMIFAQRPGPGTLLPLREPVVVGVSSGWPVPDLSGLTEAQARGMLEEIRARLVVNARESAEIPIGIIFAQDPEPGAPMPRDRVLRVIVSSGSPLPQLVGRSQREAGAVAERLGFALQARRVPMRERPRDEVASQIPEAGTRLPLDEPVRITVSDGWTTPDLLGLDEAGAGARAESQEVPVTVAGQRQTRDSPPGIVIEQQPEPGALLPPGEPVRIVLSSGYPTPRFVERQEADAQTLAAREGITLTVSRQGSLEHPTGTVIAQSPQPGAPLPRDGRVAATVASGWPTPDFLGLGEAEAGRIARDNRVTLKLLAPREDYAVKAGLVIDQQPQPRAPLPADRSVQVTFSLGWPVAPDAVGELASTVSGGFTRRHPGARVVLEESVLTLQPAGRVISQRPSAGMQLPRDQRLVLVVAVAKPPWLWGALGLLLASGGTGLFWLVRPRPRAPAVGSQAAEPPPGRPAPELAEDPSGVQLRLRKDLGSQSVSAIDDEGSEHAAAEETVRLKLVTDSGSQSVEPLDDEKEP